MKSLAMQNSRVQGTPAPGGDGTDEIAIRVRGLRKRYGDAEAVRGIDLTVRRGEIFAFLGPNGAGKTTTVETLEGYRHRNAGEVEVLGADPASPPPGWRARMGVVLQESEPEAELTVVSAFRCTPATTRGRGRWLTRSSWWAWPIARPSGAAGCRAGSAGGWMWRWP
jgi:ABC-type branched-subunit amino acid transport system ATPase component